MCSYPFFTRLMRLSVALILTLTLLPLKADRAAPPQQDQAIQTLQFNQPTKGQISNDAFRQVYTFTGHSSDVISLTLTVTNGSLVPMLILTDGQGALLTRDLSAGSANIQSWTLPADGPYFVIASRFGQDQGTTTGSYTLLLRRVAVSLTPTNVATAISGPSLTLLHYGDSLVGSIDRQYEQSYVFSAQRGDLITVTMQRISGDLDAYLILADAQGHPLAVNDDDPASPGTLDAAIRTWLIHSSGDYQIVASRFGRASGPSRGAYSLTLDRTAPDQMGNSIDLAALLDNGGSSGGTIGNDTLTRYYQFEGHRGDVVSLDVERTGGNLDPTVTLLDASQHPISLPAAGQRGQSALIRDYVISQDATYYVTVSRYSGDKGFTAGTFNLSLTGWQGTGLSVETNPNTGGPLLRLTYNSAITSTLSASNPSVSYVFSGRKGETVTIDIAALSGDLQPSLLLLDGHGQLLKQVDPGSAEAQINAFALPANDAYTITVGRHSRSEAGGSYRLTLTGGS